MSDEGLYGNGTGCNDKQINRTAKANWQRILNQALDHDNWGQTEEAVPEYEKY
jgi:hypothetical protein